MPEVFLAQQNFSSKRLAQLSRALLSRTTKRGLERAREAGVRLGRPPAEVDIERARRLRRKGRSYKRIAKRLGIGVGTLHRALNR